ncbi:TetR/AcrR family transcriptional regulator [Microterricola pindariensis]|uniref:HTH tetR-type domain-containing protein n=1 Tax=Microterricola pindariensis TaxID=478010 RepID=A0ABX5AQX9_9MICO|nr:TetR family transcriptional regulator [Microterricola pindariensis]PPL14240.1 hypothetical protein GY24_16805 [Microterricola pindariensis]
MGRTRRELTGNARRLTVEHGLNGFTVEELCEIVGVSRRTFFNYFPSKEDAVIGHRDDGLDAEALTDFINARPADCVGLSPTLLDDLLEMVIVTLGQFRDKGADITPPEAVIAREPQLLGKFLREGAEMERLLVGVIAAREGLPEGDAVAEMAVAVLTAIVRRAAALYFLPGNDTSFIEHLTRSADAATALFAAALRR